MSHNWDFSPLLNICNQTQLVKSQIPSLTAVLQIPVPKYPLFSNLLYLGYGGLPTQVKENHGQIFLNNCPISLQSVCLVIHLHLGLPSSLPPSGLPTKILYALLISYKRATCPSHLFLLDFIVQIIFSEKYKSLTSLVHSLLHTSVTSSLLDPNNLLSILTLKAHSLHSSCSVSDQVSHL